MSNEESHTDLGAIKIHKNVIASVAAMAATEIEGVKSIGRNLRSIALELMGKKSFLAIRVDIDRNGDIRIKIPVIIKYGFNIPEAANKVQENVHNALEKMTNLTIKDINVNVQGVEKCVS